MTTTEMTTDENILPPWVEQVAKVRAELARVMADATSRPEDVATAREALLRAADALSPDTFAPKVPKMAMIGDLVDDALRRVLARADGHEVPVPMPWPEIASIYRGGLWPGMHLLVAGTGAGKTQWALQLALHAAQQGIGVGYIGLELDKLQVTLRLAALLDGKTQWSTWFAGCRDEDGTPDAAPRARIHAALDKVRELRIHTEFASPNGWPASRLAEVVREVRAAHPDRSKPVLVVLDFLQLVGDEPGGRGVELRERIGRAAYTARQVAAEQDAAVLLISSTARANYMSGEETAAWARATVNGHELHNPDAIVGLGKESGETEYAADSVAVLARMATVKIDGGRAILFATPKVRAGRAKWDALQFNGTRFSPLNSQSGVAGDHLEVEAAVEKAVELGPEKAGKMRGGGAPAAPATAALDDEKKKKNGAPPVDFTKE